MTSFVRFEVFLPDDLMSYLTCGHNGSMDERGVLFEVMLVLEVLRAV